MSEAREGGRPPFVPTKEQRTFVKMGVVAGFTHDDIVKGIINPQTGNPIDGKTLRHHFRYEIDAGEIDAGVRVVGSLYNNALKGDTTAAIWYTKARLGWKSTEVKEHTGQDGGPIKTTTELSTTDQARMILFALEKAAQNPSNSKKQDD